MTAAVVLQAYWSAQADNSTTAGYLARQLVPQVADVWAHEALLALAGSASVTLLLKVLEEAGVYFDQISDVRSPSTLGFARAVTEVIGTAFAAVVKKYECLWRKKQLDDSG